MCPNGDRENWSGYFSIFKNTIFRFSVEFFNIYVFFLCLSLFYIYTFISTYNTYVHIIQFFHACKKNGDIQNERSVLGHPVYEHKPDRARRRIIFFFLLLVSLVWGLYRVRCNGWTSLFAFRVFTASANVRVVHSNGSFLATKATHLVQQHLVTDKSSNTR